MPSIINSDNGATSGSAGLKFTSADDGVLQIQNNGNTAISISSGGIATFAQPPLTVVPAFRVVMSTNKALTSTVATTVDYDSVIFNTHPDWFNTSTHRYTPQIAGYYQIIYNVSITGSGATNYYSFLVTQDSTVAQIRWTGSSGAVTLFRQCGSDLVYFNGTTNYVELRVNYIGTSATLSAGDSTTYMTGFLVRAT